MLKYFLPWSLSLLLLPAVPAGVRADAPSSDSPPLELNLTNGESGHLLARCFIPSPQRREGEMRLIREGNEHRLQILLYTPSLGRALRKMRKSELAHWPVEKLWYPSSKKYLEKLDQFRAHLREKEPENPETSHLFNLLVEYRSGVNPATVRFAEVTYTGSPEARQIHSYEEFSSLELPEAYVSSNQFFMVRDGFKLPDNATRQLLNGSPPVSE